MMAWVHVLLGPGIDFRSIAVVTAVCFYKLFFHPNNWWEAVRVEDNRAEGALSIVAPNSPGTMLRAKRRTTARQRL